MARTVKPLTDTQIKNAKPRAKEYNLPDGDGLFLRIKSNGRNNWIYNYRRPQDGNRSNLGLGTYPKISLSQARTLRNATRSEIAEGKTLARYQAIGVPAKPSYLIIRKFDSDGTQIFNSNHFDFPQPWMSLHLPGKFVLDRDGGGRILDSNGDASKTFFHIRMQKEACETMERNNAEPDESLRRAIELAREDCNALDNVLNELMKLSSKKYELVGYNE